MDYQQEKFFTIETLFCIESSSQRTPQYLVLQTENALDLVLGNCENIDFFSQCPKDEDTSQLRQIEEISQFQIEKIKSRKQRCHCKKTRCLKMYCECFSQGVSCGKDCVCIGCHNDQKYQKSKQPKRKNPQKVVTQNVGQFQQKRSTGKGCNCKKSHCEKRYCECRSAGMKCTEACQCVECNNCIPGTELIQKYRSSSAIEKKYEENTEQENFVEQQPKMSPYIIKREEPSYILMSNELLAQIDGYITA